MRMDGFVRLDGEAIDGDHAVESFVVPADVADAVSVAVPEAAAGRVEPRAVLLHYQARH